MYRWGVFFGTLLYVRYSEILSVSDLNHSHLVVLNGSRQYPRAYGAFYRIRGLWISTQSDSHSIVDISNEIIQIGADIVILLRNC